MKKEIAKFFCGFESFHTACNILAGDEAERERSVGARPRDSGALPTMQAQQLQNCVPMEEKPVLSMILPSRPFGHATPSERRRMLLETAFDRSPEAT